MAAAIALAASPPLPGARGLRHLAIDDQRMAVVHEHMAPIARLGWVGVGLAGQKSIWIDAGAMGLVAELDASEIPFRPLLAWLWSAKALARTLMAGAADRPSHRSAPAKHGTPRPAARCHPPRSARR